MSVVGSILGGSARIGRTANNAFGAPFDGQFNLDSTDVVTQSGTSMYCGLKFQSPKAIAKAYFHGASNSGFASASTPTITVTLYGRSGAAPASATDGTNLGSIAFADDTNWHTIWANDNSTKWDYAWINISVASSTTLQLGNLEFSEAVSTTASYATLDPAKRYDGDSSGNGSWHFDLGYLQAAQYDSTDHGSTFLANVGKSAGRWYWECQIVYLGDWTVIGVGPANVSLSQSPDHTVNAWSYNYSGQKYHNNSGSNYGNPYAANDVVGFALNMDIGAIWFARNNVWQASATAAEIAAGTTSHAAYTGLTGTLFPIFGGGDSNTTAQLRMTCRFDPASFQYTPPTGYLPLQVPVSAVAKPRGIILP